MDNINIKVIPPPNEKSKLEVTLKLDTFEALFLANIIGNLRGNTEKNVPTLLKFYRMLSMKYHPLTLENIETANGINNIILHCGEMMKRNNLE